MRAASVVLKYENVAGWEQLLQDLTSDWKPAGITQTLILREPADAYWRLTRVKKMATRWMQLEVEGCQDGIRERCPSADNDLLPVSGWDVLRTCSNSFDRCTGTRSQFQRIISSSISRLVSPDVAGHRATAAAEQPRKTPNANSPATRTNPEIAAAVPVPPDPLPTAGRKEAACGFHRR